MSAMATTKPIATRSTLLVNDDFQGGKLRVDSQRPHEFSDTNDQRRPTRDEKQRENHLRQNRSTEPQEVWQWRVSIRIHWTRLLSAIIFDEQRTKYSSISKSFAGTVVIVSDLANALILEDAMGGAAVESDITGGLFKIQIIIGREGRR